MFPGVGRHFFLTSKGRRVGLDAEERLCAREGLPDARVTRHAVSEGLGHMVNHMCLTVSIAAGPHTHALELGWGPVMLRENTLVRGSPADVTGSVGLDVVNVDATTFRLRCDDALVKVDDIGQLVLGHPRPFETDPAWPSAYHFSVEDAAAPAL